MTAPGAHWGQLGYSVKTGMPAFDHVFNVPIFEHLSRNPEVAAVFYDAMTSISTTEARATFRRVRLQRSSDADGRRGRTRSAAGHRSATPQDNACCAFRSSACCGRRRSDIRSRCVTGRVRIESGDFFKELPSDADAIIMKHILHDWDDESATRILQVCHRALGPRGKVLIVDPVVPSGNAPHCGKLLDLEMLVLTPRGREVGVCKAAARCGFPIVARHRDRESSIDSRSRQGVMRAGGSHPRCCRFRYPVYV